MAASKMTASQFKTWIDTNVNTNGSQGITGAILNEALSNLVLSIPFLQVEAEYRHAVSTGVSNVITFPTTFPAATTYALNVRCYDSADSPVEFEVIATAIDTFTITCVKNAFIDYSAIEDL